MIAERITSEVRIVTMSDVFDATGTKFGMSGSVKAAEIFLKLKGGRIILIDGPERDSTKLAEVELVNDSGLRGRTEGQRNVELLFKKLSESDLDVETEIDGIKVLRTRVDLVPIYDPILMENLLRLESDVEGLSFLKSSGIGIERSPNGELTLIRNGRKRTLILMEEDAAVLGRLNPAKEKLAKEQIQRAQLDRDAAVTVIRLSKATGSNIGKLVGEISEVPKGEIEALANVIFYGSGPRFEVSQAIDRMNAQRDSSSQRMELHKAKVIIPIYHEAKLNTPLIEAAERAIKSGDKNQKLIVAQEIMDTLAVQNQAMSVHAVAQKGSAAMQAKAEVAINRLAADTIQQRIIDMMGKIEGETGKPVSTLDVPTGSGYETYVRTSAGGVTAISTTNTSDEAFDGIQPGQTLVHHTGLAYTTPTQQGQTQQDQDSLENILSLMTQSQAVGVVSFEMSEEGETPRNVYHPIVNNQFTRQGISFAARAGGQEHSITGVGIYNVDQRQGHHSLAQIRVSQDVPALGLAQGDVYIPQTDVETNDGRKIRGRTPAGVVLREGKLRAVIFGKKQELEEVNGDVERVVVPTSDNGTEAYILQREGNRIVGMQVQSITAYDQDIEDPEFGKLRRGHRLDYVSGKVVDVDRPDVTVGVRLSSELPNGRMHRRILDVGSDGTLQEDFNQGFESPLMVRRIKYAPEGAQRPYERLGVMVEADDAVLRDLGLPTDRGSDGLVFVSESDMKKIETTKLNSTRARHITRRLIDGLDLAGKGVSMKREALVERHQQVIGDMVAAGEITQAERVRYEFAHDRGGRLLVPELGEVNEFATESVGLQRQAMFVSTGVDYDTETVGYRVSLREGTPGKVTDFLDAQRSPYTSNDDGSVTMSRAAFEVAFKREGTVLRIMENADALQGSESMPKPEYDRRIASISQDFVDVIGSEPGDWRVTERKTFGKYHVMEISADNPQNIKTPFGRWLNNVQNKFGGRVAFNPHFAASPEGGKTITLPSKEEAVLLGPGAFLSFAAGLERASSVGTAEHETIHMGHRAKQAQGRIIAGGVARTYSNKRLQEVLTDMAAMPGFERLAAVASGINTSTRLLNVGPEGDYNVGAGTYQDDYAEGEAQAYNSEGNVKWMRSQRARKQGGKDAFARKLDEDAF